MLTHTIRAFSLVGLILIAHTIKPFSLVNVTAFTRHTLRSFSFVLPEEAAARLEHVGELAALLGSSWSESSNLADKLVALKSSFSPADSNEVASLKAKPVSKQSSMAAKPTRRLVRIVGNLQARNRTGFGAAPLPIIPGIEGSLIPSATLMALPSFNTAGGDGAQDSQGLFPVQPKMLNLDCEWRSSFEKQTWIPEEVLQKLQDVQFSAPNVKVRVFTQRASNGQACPQSGKTAVPITGNGKQSC
jgi:hypothetical protein